MSNSKVPLPLTIGKDTLLKIKGFEVNIFVHSPSILFLSAFCLFNSSISGFILYGFETNLPPPPNLGALSYYSFIPSLSLFPRLSSSCSSSLNTAALFS